MSEKRETLPVEMLVTVDARRSRETDRLITEEQPDILWPNDAWHIQPAQARPAHEVSKVLQILDELESEEPK